MRTLRLTPWMELPVQGMEALGLHMGIDLGGADVGMAQQKLHGPQVSPAFQQVGGKDGRRCAARWSAVCPPARRIS